MSHETLPLDPNSYLDVQRPMLYFFNLKGAVHDPDDDGVDLPSIGLAREYAVRAAAEYMHDHPKTVWLGDEIRLEVTNKDQLILFTLIVMGVDAAAARDIT